MFYSQEMDFFFFFVHTWWDARYTKCSMIEIKRCFIHFIADFRSKQKLIIICTSRNSLQNFWECAFENSKTGIGSWNPLNLTLKSSTHFEFSICILRMLHSQLLWNSSTLSLCLLRTVAPIRDLFNGYSSSDGLFSRLIKNFLK